MSQIPEMMGGRTLTHDIPTTGDLQIVAGKGIKLSGQTALMTALAGATNLMSYKGEGISMGNAAHALLVSGTAGAGQTVITSNFLIIDPAGGGQNLTLPAEAACTGLLLVIFNAADAAEAITVKDDGAATIVVLDQNQAGLLYCDGTTWRGFIGGTT